MNELSFVSQVGPSMNHKRDGSFNFGGVFRWSLTFKGFEAIFARWVWIIGLEREILTPFEQVEP